MDRRSLTYGALSGFIAVGAGAFGAHALRERLTPDLLAVFETGARYQMYHALALLAISFGNIGGSRWVHWAVPAAGIGPKLLHRHLYQSAPPRPQGDPAEGGHGGIAFLSG